MPISEIIEMKKIGDANLSSLIEVCYLAMWNIESDTAEVELNIAWVE